MSPLALAAKWPGTSGRLAGQSRRTSLSAIPRSPFCPASSAGFPSRGRAASRHVTSPRRHSCAARLRVLRAGRFRGAGHSVRKFVAGEQLEPIPRRALQGYAPILEQHPHLASFGLTAPRVKLHVPKRRTSDLVSLAFALCPLPDAALSCLIQLTEIYTIIFGRRKHHPLLSCSKTSRSVRPKRDGE